MWGLLALGIVLLVYIIVLIVKMSDLEARSIEQERSIRLLGVSIVRISAAIVANTDAEEANKILADSGIPPVYDPQAERARRDWVQRN